MATSLFWCVTGQVLYRNTLIKLFKSSWHKYNIFLANFLLRCLLIHPVCATFLKYIKTFSNCSRRIMEISILYHNSFEADMLRVPNNPLIWFPVLARSKQTQWRRKCSLYSVIQSTSYNYIYGRSNYFNNLFVPHFYFEV